MKYAIISGDDFGLSDSINEAVMRSFKEGILKSASLLINAKRSKEAVELANKNQQLDLGIHLCIVQGRPILKHKDVATLLDNNGYFLKNHAEFLMKLRRNKINLREVESEFHEQIRRAFGYNLNITHLDTHQHIHIHQPILKILVKLAKKFRIPCIRYPVEMHYGVKPALATFSNITNISKFMLINTHRRGIKNILDKNNISHTDCIMGIYNAGALNNVAFKQMLSLVQEGITEIIFHPATKNEDFSKEFPGGFKNFNWEEEFRVLMNPAFKDLAAREHIEFVSFKDLT